MTGVSPGARPKVDASVALLVGMAFAVHLPIFGLDIWAAVCFSASLLLVLVFRLRDVIHVSLLASLAVLTVSSPAVGETVGSLPVLPLLIPLVVSSLLVSTSNKTRPLLDWVRAGEVSTVDWLLVAVTGLGSAIALMLWARWTDSYGIGAQMVEGIAHLPPLPVVSLVIPIFALFNAATEEAVFRGVLYTAIARSSRSAWLANAVQAVAFAAFHFEMGFPNGRVGYGMLVIYALVLGYLRSRTRGLLAPIVAHIIADLVIGYIVLFAPMMN